MNCFNHPDRPAVGMCKSCCKMLCRDCVSERENGLACREGQCADRVNLINRILSNQTKVLAAARSQNRAQVLVAVAIGAIFITFGASMLLWGIREVGMMTCAIGAVILIAGLARLRSQATFPNLEAPKKKYDPFEHAGPQRPPGR